MTDMQARVAFNEPILKALELEATRQGLMTVPRGLYDTLCGRFYVIGPRTGYRHAVHMPAETGPVSLRNRIENREARLLSLGYVRTDDWLYDPEREDDEDRYIWYHYAVNQKTHERRLLDVSSNRPPIEHDEFRLHVLLGFPNRHMLFKRNTIVPGPLDWNALEEWIFRDDQAAAQSTPVQTTT